MPYSWKHWLATACIAAAATPTLAQQSNVLRPEATNPLVVTGNDWMNSAAPERIAFLKGVATMIMAEGAYAKNTNQKIPPVSEGIIKATETVKPGEFEARITNWYEANPSKLSTPVMTVVWRNIVKKQP